MLPNMITAKHPSKSQPRWQLNRSQCPSFLKETVKDALRGAGFKEIADNDWRHHVSKLIAVKQNGVWLPYKEFKSRQAAAAGMLLCTCLG
jgi:hypothetical protein